MRSIEVHTVGMDAVFVQGVHSELDGKYVKIVTISSSIFLPIQINYIEKKCIFDYPHCWRTGHPLLLWNGILVY